MRGYGVKCDTCGILDWTDQKAGLLPKTIPVPLDWIVLTIDRKTTIHCSFDCVETYHKTPVFDHNDFIEDVQ